MSVPAPDLPTDLMVPVDGEPSGELSTTLKEGGGYDACWLTIKAANAPEFSNLIQRLRQLHALSGLHALAAEFRGQPVTADALDRAEATVLKTFPGATEVPDTVTPQPSGPPVQSSPPCGKCGALTQYREGMGANGSYKGYACAADKTHFEFIK